jgi:hypothetical protein
VFEFDSSYDRAIAKAMGKELGSVEIREIANNSRFRTYDVFARDFQGEDAEPKPLHRVGLMKARHKEEIQRRLDHGAFDGGW